MPGQLDYTDYPDTELYDAFFDAGTLLGGCLNALQDAAERDQNLERAHAWEVERRQMLDERDAIAVDCREAQISAIRRWRARYEQLSD